MAGETMLDGGSPMLPPPPPTFRAPTRDSVLAATRGKRSSTLDEDDLSFMDKEIKRLHRDMANMLAKETPLADDNNPRALSTPSALYDGASSAGGIEKGGGVVISRRTSPAGDSDFDYSDDDDDDDGIAILKDDLRTTTEKFFERLPRQGQEQHEGGRPSRRASAYVSSAPSGSASSSAGHHNHSGGSDGGSGPCVGTRQQQSWNALEGLEKGVGGMMRRQSRNGGSSSGSGGTAGVGVGGEAPVLPLPHEGEDPFFVGGGLGGRSRDRTSSYPPSSPSPRGGGGEVSRRRPPRDSGASVTDLKARSEEAARTLKALKILLVEEEGLHGGENEGRDDTPPPRQQQQQQRRGASKLWPVGGGGERTVEVSPTTGVGGAGGGGGGGGGSGSDGDASMRMKLLLRAMENLQHINAELKSELRVSRRRTTSGRDRDRDRHRCHDHDRRASSSLSSSSPRPVTGRHSLGRQPSQRLLQAAGASAAAQPRSSSDLLRNRRSEKGQAEPMSCGVPRHRVQVSKGGDNNVVYFELAITQARSTWTLERRMDEFVELRGSLVATATDLAAAAGAADRERQAAARAAGQQQFVPPSSSPPSPPPAGSCGSDGGNGVGSGGGGENSGKAGGGRNLADARRDYRREAEARVPQLPAERRSWFDSTGIWSVMYGRKREEKLTERQVHLASWLANVLADRELVSPELVRFLGGDSGGVQAQPVVEDVVPGDEDDDEDDDNDDDNDDLLGNERANSWSSSSSGVDDGTDEDLGSDELNSLRGSLCAPEEWDVAAKSGSGSGVDDSSGGGGDSRRGGGRAVSPRDRLEKAMGNRLAVQAGGGGEGAGAGGASDGTSFSRITAGTPPGGGTATDDEEGEDGDGEGEEEEAQQSLLLKKAFLASVDASRQPRAPSPSSPTRRVTLDAFFQAPT